MPFSVVLSHLFCGLPNGRSRSPPCGSSLFRPFLLVPTSVCLSSYVASRSPRSCPRPLRISGRYFSFEKCPDVVPCLPPLDLEDSLGQEVGAFVRRLHWWPRCPYPFERTAHRQSRDSCEFFSQ